MNRLLSSIPGLRAVRIGPWRMRRIAPLVLAWWSLSVVGAALQPCVAAIAGQSSAAHASQERKHSHTTHGDVTGQDSQPVNGSHCPDYLDMSIMAEEVRQAPARDKSNGAAVIIPVVNPWLQGQLLVLAVSTQFYRATVHPPDILRRTARLLI